MLKFLFVLFLVDMCLSPSAAQHVTRISKAGRFSYTATHMLTIIKKYPLGLLKYEQILIFFKFGALYSVEMLQIT